MYLFRQELYGKMDPLLSPSSGTWLQRPGVAQQPTQSTEGTGESVMERFRVS